MTLEEFLPLLSDGTWQINESKEVRCGPHCPITYVAKKLTGTTWGTWEFDKAGPAIELDKTLISEIISAADNFATSFQGLRAKLLEACGLSE